MRSDPDLIQQTLRRDRLYPWRMLVACLLLNKTRGVAVRPVLSRVLSRWPTPAALASADGRSLGPAVARLGLRKRRTRLLKEMSREYSAGLFDSPSDLPGVGRYASDSWAIFVGGRLDVKPEDIALRRYIKYILAKKRGL